jgi:CRISPR-associated endonuclease Cas1
LLDPDGYLSFEAVDWLINQKVHVLFLNRDGNMLGTLGPPRPRETSLLRAQVRAVENGGGLNIARGLIEYKLAGQERIARSRLRNAACADAIASFRAGLPAAATVAAIRYLEAQGAAFYWKAWSTLPVTFPRSESKRTPSHWQTFGSRQSVLTSSPRAAINPANAMLNYTYTVLLFESVIALSAMGLDPELGYLHLDAANRDSLACDVMEAVRPEVDGYLLDWLTGRPLKREWFRESKDGQCLLRYDLCSILSETASMWRSAVAPWAEWIAHMLWVAHPERVKRPATRLTGRHKREISGASPLPRPATGPKAPAICRICGVGIKRARPTADHAQRYFSGSRSWLLRRPDGLRHTPPRQRGSVEKPEAVMRLPRAPFVRRTSPHGSRRKRISHASSRSWPISPRPLSLPPWESRGRTPHGFIAV